MICVFSLLSSLSIFFEKGSRKTEIALFVFVKSFKSYYEYLLRRNLILEVPFIDKICFVGVFSLISLLYYRAPQHLKHKFMMDHFLNEH